MIQIFSPRAALAAALIFGAGGGAVHAGQTHGVCVENRTGQRMYFAAQSETGPRRTGWLSHGQRLCSPADRAQGGVVSVFTDPGALEGCSRLSGVDQTQTILQYANVDRCLWAEPG